MITSIIVFGGAAGALLAFRQFKVFVLVPASLLAAIGVILHSRVTGQDFGATVIDFYREHLVSADWLFGWRHC